MVYVTNSLECGGQAALGDSRTSLLIRLRANRDYSMASGRQYDFVPPSCGPWIVVEAIGPRPLQFFALDRLQSWWPVPKMDPSTVQDVRKRTWMTRRRGTYRVRSSTVALRIGRMNCARRSHGGRCAT